MKKRCTTCRRTLVATEKNFHRQTKNKDGLNPQCRHCRHNAYLAKQGRKPVSFDMPLITRRKTRTGTRKIAEIATPAYRYEFGTSTPLTLPLTNAAPVTIPVSKHMTITTNGDLKDRATVTINGTLYLPITAFAVALGVPEKEIVELVNQ